ncbi:hypothetical protein FOXB_10631 [Fusarium oxysporum f. sp. conglutinans Fo5176]|uniref:MADS-box domain-containing protein n=1 Tax=Fusarium oxysporum (strain Fo5176) TaxID=660025 RepID=F9FW50_FUSOF|nr:hypothetical protein FOXB_10631 [Fusarium oxysporum f. sp. conglutinans Fo5176]
MYQPQASYPEQPQLLSTTIETIRKERRKRTNMFSKRRTTLIKKVEKLHRECDDIDVFFIVRDRRSNKIWQYSNGYYPPTRAEMQSIYPVPVILQPQDEQIQPPTVIPTDPFHEHQYQTNCTLDAAFLG